MILVRQPFAMPMFLFLSAAMLLTGIKPVQADHDLHIVYFEDYAPYSWNEDDKHVRGVFIDILEEVFREDGEWQLVHEGLPWPRAQEYVRNGSADALVAPITRERLEYANASKSPVLIGRLTAFTRSGHPHFRQFTESRDLADLKKYRFITQIGDGWAAENLAGMDLIHATTLSNVLNMLSRSRADLFIEASLVGHHNIRQQWLQDRLIEVPGLVIEETPFHLLIGKKSHHQALESFERGMARLMTSGRIEALLSKYWE